jgi:hypothetical protein
MNRKTSLPIPDSARSLIVSITDVGSGRSYEWGYHFDPREVTDARVAHDVGHHTQLMTHSLTLSLREGVEGGDE